MQEFTLAQIGMQVTALQNFFDQVTLIDPLAQAEVDPVTLQATGHADAVPVLNADGRGWQPILGEDTGFVFLPEHPGGEPPVCAGCHLFPYGRSARQ